MVGVGKNSLKKFDFGLVFCSPVVIAYATKKSVSVTLRFCTRT